MLCEGYSNCVLVWNCALEINGLVSYVLKGKRGRNEERKKVGGRAVLCGSLVTREWKCNNWKDILNSNTLSESAWATLQVFFFFYL